MVADHQAVVGQTAKGHGLDGGSNPLGMLDGFEGTQKMSNRTGTADSGQKGGDGNNRFTFGTFSVKTAVIFDNKFKVGDFVVADGDMEASSAFDFGNVVDGDVLRMHKSFYVLLINFIYLSIIWRKAVGSIGQPLT